MVYRYVSVKQALFGLFFTLLPTMETPAVASWLQELSSHKKRCMQAVAEQPAKIQKIPFPKQTSSCSQESSDKALFRQGAAHMPAQVITSGGSLDYLAKRAVRVLRLAAKSQGTKFLHRYGSMCSGSEVLKFVLESLSKALGGTHVFIPVFTCELESKKREWLMALSPECCCFNE